ncbi:MAG: hypothetical protein L3J52_01855 [Proteobacteria bacterium]|nr:hypothetical protein [Pseudomonadota bacterium]
MKKIQEINKQIKLKRKSLKQKKTVLQINRLSQPVNTKSEQEIAKAIKQLDLLSAQLHQLDVAKSRKQNKPIKIRKFLSPPDLA